MMDCGPGEKKKMSMESSAKSMVLKDLLKKLYSAIASKKGVSVEVEMEGEEGEEEGNPVKEALAESMPEEEGPSSLAEMMQEEMEIKKKRMPKNYAMMAIEAKKAPPMMGKKKYG